jgi:hypothetical protein
MELGVRTAQPIEDILVTVVGRVLGVIAAQGSRIDLVSVAGIA